MLGGLGGYQRLGYGQPLTEASCLLGTHRKISSAAAFCRKLGSGLPVTLLSWTVTSRVPKLLLQNCLGSFWHKWFKPFGWFTSNLTIFASRCCVSLLTVHCFLLATTALSKPHPPKWTMNCKCLDSWDANEHLSFVGEIVAFREYQWLRKLPPPVSSRTWWPWQPTCRNLHEALGLHLETCAKPWASASGNEALEVFTLTKHIKWSSDSWVYGYLISTYLTSIAICSQGWNILRLSLWKRWLFVKFDWVYRVDISQQQSSKLGAYRVCQRTVCICSYWLPGILWHVMGVFPNEATATSAISLKNRHVQSGFGYPT